MHIKLKACHVLLSIHTSFFFLHSNRQQSCPKCMEKKSHQTHVCLHEASIDEIMTINSSPDCQTNTVPIFENSRFDRSILSVPRIRTVNSKPSAMQLPVYLHKTIILNAIRQNQVIVISSETGTMHCFFIWSNLILQIKPLFWIYFVGSGKTTQVPQFILEDCWWKDEKCKIILTQPRRIAATSIAKRISSERGETHGSTVGHQIRMDSCVQSKTNLIITTRWIPTKA